MALVNGLSLNLVGSTFGSETVSLAGVRYLTTLELGGITYVYATSHDADTVQVLRMDSDGELTPLGFIEDDDQVSLNGALAIHSVEVEGRAFVLVSGRNDGGLTLFEASATAPYLTPVDTVFDPESVILNLLEVWCVEVVTVSGGTFAYAGSAGDDGLSVFSISSLGQLRNVQNVYDIENPNYALQDPHMIKAFSLSGTDYLAVAGRGDNGISIFEIDDRSGVLSFVTSYVSGSSLNMPWQIEATEIDGNAYLYVGLEGTHAITGLRFDGANLQVTQTIASQARLDGANGISLIEAGGGTLVAVHNYYAGTIEVFELDTDPLSFSVGQLSPVQTLEAPGTDGSRDGSFVTVEGRSFFVSAGDEGGALSVFQMGGLDDVLNGTQGADQIYGFEGDDIIYAMGGTDVIDGGEGSDIIYAGSGADTIMASLGDDHIYAGSGYDSFELDALNTLEEGLTVDLFNARMIFEDGSLQTVSGVERVYATNYDDLLLGDDQGNGFYGQSGDDQIYGLDGNDFLYGQDGVDKIIGGDGDDFINAGAGDDTNVNGGSGNDKIDGGSGNDALFGGIGDDVIDGGNDDDFVYGNEGNDTLTGGDGEDDIRGGTGNDSLWGGSGNDFMMGDAGDDVLSMGPGNDTASGGAGADVFEFRMNASGGGGFNTVQDFTDGQDRLDLSDYGISFAQLVVIERSWGTRIDMSDGQQIALQHLDAGDFDISDVIL